MTAISYLLNNKVKYLIINHTKMEKLIKKLYNQKILEKK